MKQTVAVLCCALLVVSANAVTLDVPRLPTPSFADREAADDTAVSANAQGNLRRFRLELTFDATLW